MANLNSMMDALRQAMLRPLTMPGSDTIAASVLQHFADVAFMPVFAKKALQTLADGEQHNTVAINAEPPRFGVIFVAWNGSHRLLQSQRYGNYIGPLFSTGRKLVESGIPLAGILQIDAYVREDDPAHLLVDIEYSCLPGFMLGADDSARGDWPAVVLLNPDLCTDEERELLDEVAARSRRG